MDTGTRVKHVLVLIGIGLLVRLAVFNDVAVNGDTGLYLYDARQLTWGRQMLVEYPSRSPVFEYALAGVLSLGQSPLLSARAFMLTIGLALGVAIYAFASKLHSHRAGLLAAGMLYLTPFSVVWGLWVKTEQAAGLLVMVGFIVGLAYIDRENIPTGPVLAVGVLFGLAFLIRRVTIVHIGAFTLFVCWYRWSQHREARSTVVAAVSVLGGSIVTLGLSYILLARGDLTIAVQIADSHAVALFASNGQGSLGWIPLDTPRAVTAESRTSLFAQVCQKCGWNTVGVFMTTLLVTLPAVLPLLIFLRSFTSEAGFVGDVVLPVSFVIPGLYALVGLYGTPYWSRSLAVFAGILAVAMLWYIDPVKWDDLWNPKLALPIFILLSLTAGYLYRDRILYITYFQDFYPYVVSLSAISLVELFRRHRPQRQTILAGVCILLVLTMAVGATNAYPYRPHSEIGNNDWFTIELAQQYGADIDDRLDEDERVFTAQPLYVIESEHRLAADLSRKYYLFRGWPNSDLKAATEADIIDALRSGDVKLVIVDSEMQTVFGASPAIEETVESEFEPVEDNSLYELTNATLYEYRPSE